MWVNGRHSATRDHILQSALKIFAECGYAATSIQTIVDNARVSKPALYYYFGDKAGLFRALVERAHDERLRLMQEAAAKGGAVGEKLENILTAVFEFTLKNRELMRLAFATAFAAKGETPVQPSCCEKGRRNFEFVRDLIADGQRSGELSQKYEVDEMAMAIYGQLNSYVMLRLFTPEIPLNQKTAKAIVGLFLDGAKGNKHQTSKTKFQGKFTTQTSNGRNGSGKLSKLGSSSHKTKRLQKL